MEYKFINYDSKKEIKLNAEEKFILIYGRNGSGKTTFSKQEYFDSKYVFNEDFIISNVYTISDDGATQTSKVKENFSGLWLGENIVKVRKEISTLSEIEKNIRTAYNQVQGELGQFFLKKQIPFNILTKLEELKDDSFVINFDNDIEDEKNKYKTSYQFNTLINNEDELNDNINYVQHNDLYNMLIDEIKESKLLSNIILKEENNFLNILNSSIDSLNKNKSILDEIEKVYDKDNIDPNLSLKINEWLTIHEKRTSCIFCGNEEIGPAIDKWKNIFSNTYIEEKNKLRNQINDEIIITKNIIDEVKYDNIDHEVYACVNEIRLYLNNMIDNIQKNIFNKISYSCEIKKRDIFEKNKIINNIVNYKLNEKKNVLGFYFNSLKKIDELKKEKQDLSDLLMENEGAIIADGINEKFIDFGLNKSIKISVDKYSIPHKFNYSIENHKSIKELSDGQKHKLALAIFINHLEKIDLSNKTIVIDDPVVSLDISSYILFKQYLINKLTKHFTKDTKLIILTHDITYLYIQLSNIFNNQKMKKDTAVFKLNSNELKRIPLDYIKTDDITLFRDALDHTTNLKELKCLNSIIIKIFRIEIDIKLRFYGVALTDGMGIEKLELGESDKKFLKEASSYIVETSRRNNPSYEEILKNFIYLKKGSEILGFDNYITDKHITNIKNIIKSNIDGEYTYEIFELISSVNLFLKNCDNDEMIHYVEHTRNSYTRNIIGLGLDDYFE